jgi:cAMP-dependent protein kinase regulator
MLPSKEERKEHIKVDTYLKTYESGESFGELALLYNAPRAASIKAKNTCNLYELDRETFNHIVKDAA